MIDTTPTVYPRPDDARVFEAMEAVFRVAECITPDSEVRAAELLRFVIPNGVTVAQSMWAIHELTQRGGFDVFRHGEERPKRWPIFDPPAGVTKAAGRLHFAGGEDCWNELIFVPNHKKLDESRKSLRLPSDSKKQLSKRMPDNTDVLDLCKKLAERKAGRSLMSVAREFTKEPADKCPKAGSLLRQARRFPHLWKPDN